MRPIVSCILLAMIAVFPSGISAQIKRPLWVDTESSNFPAEVESIVFPNGNSWDGDHPNPTVGRWQISRSGPLTEHLSPGTQLGHGVPCSSRDRSDCFYAYIEPFDCHNSAAPTLTYCTMTLSWSPHDGARCEIFVASPSPHKYPTAIAYITSFRIGCPEEIHLAK